MACYGTGGARDMGTRKVGAGYPSGSRVPDLPSLEEFLANDPHCMKPLGEATDFVAAKRLREWKVALCETHDCNPLLLEGGSSEPSTGIDATDASGQRLASWIGCRRHCGGYSC